jgi:spermidine synthase
MSEAEKECLFRQVEPDTLIEVWQQGDKRRLLFDEKVIQSEMLLTKPDQLVLPLHQYLLAGCLLTELPANILLAGTGGASLARYFSHRFPFVIGDAVEISPLICRLASEYFSFPEQNWILYQQDIRDYLVESQRQYDLIVFDLAEGMYSPRWLLDMKLLLKMRQCLTENGHIAFNLLVANDADFMLFLAAIRVAFGEQTVCLSVPNYRNVLVFAYNSQPQFTHQQIEHRIDEFKRVWQLGFDDFWSRIQQENPRGSGVI